MTSQAKPVTPGVPDHIIFVVRKTLSDGSHVFDVVYGEHIIPAYTEDDARDLAEKISDAINEHSVQIAGVVWQD